MSCSRNVVKLIAALSMPLLLGACSFGGEPDLGDANMGNADGSEVAIAVEEEAVRAQDGIGAGIYDGIPSGDDGSGLMSVVSTEGDNGYIYVRQFERASTGGVTNPDEAVAFMQDGMRASNKALAQALTDALPDGYEVTEEQAAACLDSTIRSYALDPSCMNIDGAFSDAISNLAESSGVPEELLASIAEEAFREAQLEVGVVLPVYEADGKTQIGDFVVGGLR